MVSLFSLHCHQKAYRLAWLAVFILSSFPLLHRLKTGAKLKCDYDEVKEIPCRIKELFRGFLQTWWGFIIGAFIMTAIRGYCSSMKISFTDIGSFLMATTVLFGLFETMVTGWVVTNMGNYRRGQFGYTLTLVAEFSMYNILLCFAWILEVS